MLAVSGLRAQHDSIEVSETFAIAVHCSPEQRAHYHDPAESHRSQVERARKPHVCLPLLSPAMQGRLQAGLLELEAPEQALGWH